MASLASHDSPLGTHVKRDVQEDTLPPPSNEFRAAFERIRGNNSAATTDTADASHSRNPTLDERRAKPEPAERRLHDPSRLHGNGANNDKSADPRLGELLHETINRRCIDFDEVLKRVKEEESNGTHGQFARVLLENISGAHQ